MKDKFEKLLQRVKQNLTIKGLEQERENKNCRISAVELTFEQLFQTEKRETKKLCFKKISHYSIWAFVFR